MNSVLQQWRFVVRECASIHTCASLQAARKGTRMRKEAVKKANTKIEIKKVFIPYAKKLEMEKVGLVSPRDDDSERPIAIDDVYFAHQHRLHNYSMAETVEMHRETAHPTMFNKPKGSIIAHIELAMSADKKNKYHDVFSNIVMLPHPYPVSHRRTLMTLCKDDEMIELMRALEVDLSVGPEFSSLIEKGEIDFKAYDFIIAHHSLLPDLVPYRTQLKKKMPSVSQGTAGGDLVTIVERFQKGIKYEVIKDKYDHDFASVNVVLGPMTWEPEKLEENLKAILIDIEIQRLVKIRSDNLITKLDIKSQHSKEKFQMDFKKYFEEEKEIDQMTN